MPARILIIEDNPTNMELIAFLLEAFGYIPIQAYDGEQGLAAAVREMPDLIVCDVTLPKLDGYDVVRALKNDLALSHTPVIAVTALAMVGDREKLLAAGFDDYISKPIEPEIFVGQIEKLLHTDLHTERTQETPPVADTAAAPWATAKKARILVVDDSPINRELIRCTLEPSGYGLTLADSVQQGAKLVRQADFDLILSDLHMPEEDGIALLKLVKADPALASIPFMFISASYQEDNNFPLAMELGAFRFLQRPIDPQALVAEIEACLSATKENYATR
ncbi:MAG TPA: response regulator [Novimethylophilus sp.]|jgi:two-component system cell cycle response regulator|uniref:response regulator n=1 Tax=Novimethylophilus sp. TaxID=2137426 RepID=UPI002F3FCA34